MILTVPILSPNENRLVKTWLVSDKLATGQRYIHCTDI